MLRDMKKYINPMKSNFQILCEKCEDKSMVFINIIDKQTLQISCLNCKAKEITNLAERENKLTNTLK